MLNTEPEGLLDAFWAYERALMTNDLAALDELFATGPETVRADASGVLVGHATISAFRGGRGGAPQRRIVDVHVRAIDENHGLVMAVTEFLAGGRGVQTQLWERANGAWAVVAAHVSGAAQAFDRRIWRIVGDPLVPSIGAGPLLGQRVAVKDLYAVAGHAVGAGNPDWLEGAPVEQSHAFAVQALIAAGADIAGISRTDEFAYSLAGDNAHYGMPPNPAAPQRLSGGSSSGSASAVSMGQASIGLGTDTGGSIRIPAAYQGLYGIRTSHGAISRAGLMALAPSFDTVGWMTRDAHTLRAVGQALLPERAPTSMREIVVLSDVFELASSEVVAAAHRLLAAWGAGSPEVSGLDLEALRDAFVTRQAAEAWAAHGWWLQSRMDSLGADVRGRFERARDLSDDEIADSVGAVDAARSQILELVGERILVVPAAPNVAPRLGSDMSAVRDATLKLTCIAGLGGLPAVVIPLRTSMGRPSGICLLAAPGRDQDLLDLAVELAPLAAASAS